MREYEIVLLALTLWREARNQTLEAKQAVASSIRNRVRRPGWWGTDWVSVLCKRLQYSSMTAAGDPNLVKWPTAIDTSWQSCLEIAQACYEGTIGDPTGGATHYFDKSLDANPPVWAASMTHVCDVGNFHFYE